MPPNLLHYNSILIDNPHFEDTVNRIYPPGARFTKLFMTELIHKI